MRKTQYTKLSSWIQHQYRNLILKCTHFLDNEENIEHHLNFDILSIQWHSKNDHNQQLFYLLHNTKCDQHYFFEKSVSFLEDQRYNIRKCFERENPANNVICAIRIYLSFNILRIKKHYPHLSFWNSFTEKYS